MEAAVSQVGSKADRYDEDQNMIEFGTTAEQKDESHYDSRYDADDDLAKNMIKFPDNQLYGREEEIEKLLSIFQAAQPQAPPNHTPSEPSPESADNNNNPVSTDAHKDTDAHGSPTNHAVFLTGISGTGKSSLVQESLRRLRAKGGDCYFIGGKYQDSKNMRPFSAINEGLRTFITKMVENEEELKQLRKRLAQNDLDTETHDVHVLSDTMTSSITTIFRQKKIVQQDSSSLGNTSVGASALVGVVNYDMSAIKFAFRAFLMAVSSGKHPLILFLDDLQWADEASLALLSAQLKDPTLRNIVFIGSYRTNVVDEKHPLFAMMKDAEESRGAPHPTHRMEIFNLSPITIGQFIADSLVLPIEEVAPITEVVYEKTLGNIFFVKQALSELVRRNAIYYDVVFFTWQFGDVTRVQLEEFLHDDVLTMVENRIHDQPHNLQLALSVAAFTRNVIDVDILQALLRAVGLAMDSVAVEKLMAIAVHTGFLLELESRCVNSNRAYKFAHDRIQEAAIACVPPGEQRDQMLHKLAQELVKLDRLDDDDWMLFVAVNHLNSLPEGKVEPIEIVQLNLRVGKIAISKAAFGQAASLLRIGAEQLKKMNCWEDNYDLALDLCNNLMEMEHSLGQHEAAIAIASEITAHASSLPEKCRANLIEINVAVHVPTRDYARGAALGVKVLRDFGIDVPLKPTERYLRREKLYLQVARRGRPLYKLVNSYPISEDPLFSAQVHLLHTTFAHATFSGNERLSQLIGYRALRLTLKNQMITKFTPSMIALLGLPYRKAEKYREGYSYATACSAILARFPGDNSQEIATAKLVLYSSMLLIGFPYRDSISKYLEIHKTLISSGLSEYGMGSAMDAIFACFIAGIPLNTLYDAKLQQFEELSINLGRTNYLLIFRLFRQTLYNLQGKVDNPTQLIGEVFDENEVLSKLEEGPRKMNLRDISIMRIMLAVIFDEEETMETTLDTLSEYPAWDHTLPRQHTRMSWVSLAVWILKARGETKHDKWAKTCMNFFRKQSDAGSPNARPIFACMMALKSCSVADFDHAIHESLEANLLNLAALMSERCSEHLKENEKKEEYMKNAYWYYHDWGALGKTRQLQERHSYLVNASVQGGHVGTNAVIDNLNNTIMGVSRPPPASSDSG